MSIYILPILFLFVFAYAMRKKINAYDTFVNGAKKSIPLVVGPYKHQPTLYNCMFFPIHLELI